MTLKVIHRLQTCSHAICRTFVQHFTQFQLTVCSHGSSGLAELLVNSSVKQEALLLQRNRATRYVSWNIMADFCICSVFRRLRDLMANIFWTKRDTDNRKRALESTRGFLHCLIISWTLVHKWHKIGSEFSPTLRNSELCFPRVAHENRTQPNVAKLDEINGADASRIRWRRIVNVNATIEIRSLVSEAQKYFKLAMASRRAAFSGNTIC